MTEPLYKFQKDAVNRIAKGDQVYLGFDPGLGKSRTALETAKRRGVMRLLVICPASGRYVWESEAKKWAPAMPFCIVRGVGDKEKQAGTVAVRTRSGEDLGALPLEVFIERLRSEASA